MRGFIITRLKHYYALTKPGIIRGNLITGAAGFLLAAQSQVDLWRLIAFLSGMSLMIASACVFNNYIDRDIDALMDRTRQRAFVRGVVSVRLALLFGAVLGLAGFWLLARFANLLTALIGLVGFVDYVFLYGVGKRRTVHGTIIGSIAGAMPPVAGYTAVTAHLDLAAWLLFGLMVFWQMPHFYAIAIYRSADYKAAGLPVLPLKKGIEAAKRQMFGYILAFSLAAMALAYYGYSGYLYLVVAGLLSWTWLSLSLKGFRVKDSHKWARQMFFTSLVVIILLSLAMSIDAIV